MANPNTLIPNGSRENYGIALGNGINLTSVQWTFQDLKNAAAGVASGVAFTSNLFIAPSTPPFGVAGPTLSFGAGAVVLYTRIKHSVAFSGGAISGLTASVGKSGSLTLLTTALNCFAAVSDTALVEVFSPLLGQLSSVTPTITWTPTGDALANLTAGVLNVDILWAQVTTPNYVANGVTLNTAPL